MVCRKTSIMARALAISMIAALVLILMGTAMGEVTRDGLVAEYHFDGDAKDTSGNGNDGTIYGATFVDGISGQALSFNGADDYVSIPDSVTLKPQQVTVEAWIKPNTNTIPAGSYGYTTGAPIVNYAASDSDSYGRGYAILFEDNNVFNFRKGSGDGSWENTIGTNNKDAGRWYYVVGTYDGLKMYLYVDGILEKSFTPDTQGISYSNVYGLYIGKNRVGPLGDYSFFNGIIDEVRIYNRALSADEIKAEYDAYTSPSSSQLTSAPPISSATITSNASPVSTNFILENANNYKILLDSDINLQDSASLSRGAYYVVSYSNLFPYASGIEVLSSEGRKITSESEVEPVFTSIAWKEASWQVKPSDIQTMKDILQTSKDIDSAVSPVLGVTSTTISSINSLQSACISVPLVGKKCAWDAVSAAFPAISTLTSQLESLNSELNQWKSAATSVQQHLPNAISGIEQAKSGGDINPQLQSEISQSLSAFGTLQSKTNDISGRLASVSSTLSDAESGVRNAASTPIVGSLISPVANAIGSLRNQVDSLKGKADSFSHSMGEQSAKLSAVTDTANKRNSELKSMWSARQSAPTMVYGTIGGIAIVFIIVILLVHKKRSGKVE